MKQSWLGLKETLDELVPDFLVYEIYKTGMERKADEFRVRIEFAGWTNAFVLSFKDSHNALTNSVRTAVEHLRSLMYPNGKALWDHLAGENLTTRVIITRDDIPVLVENPVIYAEVEYSESPIPHLGLVRLKTEYVSTRIRRGDDIRRIYYNTFELDGETILMLHPKETPAKTFYDSYFPFRCNYRQFSYVQRRWAPLPPIR